MQSLQDEGIGSPRDDEYEDSGRENIEIRLQLDKERRQNTILQEKVRKSYYLLSIFYER